MLASLSDGSVCKCAFERAQVLAELRDYIATVPGLVDALQPKITEIMKSFAVLDEFDYRLSKDDFKLRWNMFGWPKTIHDGTVCVCVCVRSRPVFALMLGSARGCASASPCFVKLIVFVCVFCLKYVNCLHCGQVANKRTWSWRSSKLNITRPSSNNRRILNKKLP
jgi:hypothetical protein